MNCLKAYGTSRVLRSSTSFCLMSTNPSDSESVSASPVNTLTLPEEPTTCCMSGCANCVWIEYAEQLSKIFDDGGQKSKDIILSRVSDPNMKAFLLMELKTLDMSKNQNNSN